jgi:hypothetical protein
MSLADGLAVEIEAYNRLVPREDGEKACSPSMSGASRTFRAGDRSM